METAQDQERDLQEGNPETALKEKEAGGGSFLKACLEGSLDVTFTFYAQSFRPDPKPAVVVGWVTAAARYEECCKCLKGPVCRI